MYESKKTNMKEISKPMSNDCDRCGEHAIIHTTTNGGFLLCDLCARKMTFDREFTND